jgi:hypothetical protein
MTIQATRFSASRLARRALPLLAFVVMPMATVTAVAATTVTGTALPGTLTATYPATVALTSATLGTPAVTNLNVAGGAILVSDNRGSTGGTWSTTATMTNFTTVVASANTIPASSLSVSPGAVIAAATNPAGSGATAGAASQTFAGTVTFMSATGGLGTGTFGLNPSFTWSPPANTVAAASTGTAYQATMTFTTQ